MFKMNLINPWLKAMILFLAFCAGNNAYSQALQGNEFGHDWVDMGTSVMWSTSDVYNSQDNINGYSYYTFYGAQLAAEKWGGGWRLPSMSEFQELIDKCSWEVKDTGTVKVTARNGNVLYFKLKGYAAGTIRWSVSDSSIGFYWTSTKYAQRPDTFSYLLKIWVRGSVSKGISSESQSNGCFARPVIKIF